MRKTLWAIVMLAAGAALLWAVTVSGNLDVLGTLTAAVVDFTGSTSTAPMKAGTALPASCSIGQAFFKTDAAAGQNIYLCTAANTWTQVQGGGGGGSFDWKPDSRYIWSKADFLGLYANIASYSEGGFVFVRDMGSQNLNNPRGSIASALELGMAAISTTATSGNRTRYYTQLHAGQFPGDGNGLYGLTTVPWEVVIRFRWPTAADWTNSTTAIAFAADTPGWPTRGIGVRYIDGTDTYLTFYSANGDGIWGTTSATTVTPDAAWHRLRIRSDGATAFKVWVSLDGGPEVDVCPSGCTLTQADSGGTTINRLLFGIQTDEAAQKLFQLDYVHFWLDRGVAR